MTKSKKPLKAPGVIEPEAIIASPTKKIVEKNQESVENVSKPIIAPQQITLANFIAISGKKPDQMAGFKHFAIKNSLVAHSVMQWRELYTKFLNRPVS